MDVKGQFRTINEKNQFIQEISCGLCMDTSLNFKNQVYVYMHVVDCDVCM
jgi:hypothetical protein